MSELADRVRELRDRLDRLDHERAVVQRELDEIAEAMGVRPEAKRRQRRPRQRPIRDGSMLDFARKVLEARGKPWYIDDLLKDVQSMSGRPIQKSSLVASLSRFVRAGDTFSRPKEGYYALRSPEEAA